MEQSNFYQQNNEKVKIIYRNIKVEAQTERECLDKMFHLYYDVHGKVNR